VWACFFYREVLEDNGKNMLTEFMGGKLFCHEEEKLLKKVMNAIVRVKFRASRYN
jgi:hypothetical protein